MNLQNASHPSGIALKEEELTIYTDGSCIDNRKLNARCGGGIWISENHDYDRALRIPGTGPPINLKSRRDCSCS